MREGGEESGKNIVVAETDFFVADGVVLVDDGDGSLLEETLQGVLDVLGTFSTAEILASEEDLSCN